MENITKRFPGVVANQNVHLRVASGTFHAVIGENGAGKSTLLNILYGRYRPDAGRIFVAGEEVSGALRSPADAIRRGIGLVSQHYALIPALTVLENVMLGAEGGLPGGILQPRKAGARVRQLADTAWSCQSRPECARGTAFRCRAAKSRDSQSACTGARVFCCWTSRRQPLRRRK